MVPHHSSGEHLPCCCSDQTVQQYNEDTVVILAAQVSVEAVTFMSPLLCMVVMSPFAEDIATPPASYHLQL